jgi:hypothetical protein
LVRTAFANKLEEVLSRNQAKGDDLANAKTMKGRQPQLTRDSSASGSTMKKQLSMAGGALRMPVTPAAVLPPASGAGRQIAPAEEALPDVEELELVGPP